MNRLKSNVRRFKGTQEFWKVTASQLLNLRTSIIFITFCSLLATPYCLYAGGTIYWTPNGVLLNNFESSAGSPVDDGKGGAILFSIRPYGIGQDSVIALRIDRNGNSLWGLQGKTLDNYAGWQGPLRGVSDGRGGAIVIWSRVPSMIMYYQRVDSLGNRMWGANAQRVTLSDSVQWYPVVVSDGAKGMIVAWQEHKGEQGMNFNWNIHAQRIDSTGVRRWGDYGVAVCTADSSQETPVITCDINENSIIAWTDLRNGSYDVYGQRLNNNGASMWSINGIAICDTVGAQGSSGITMSTDTTIILTWTDGRYGFANRDVYAQCLSSSGLDLWMRQGVPVCDTINRQEGGQLIADGQGGAIFCWIDQRNGYWNLYAQRLNSNGQRQWTNQGVPITTTDSAYWYQRIVTDGQSGAIISWQDKRSGNWDVYAQHVDSSGTILWDTNGMPVCTANNNQEYPEMTASDSSRAIICWSDYRSGQARGYAQKVGDEIIGIKEMTENRCLIADNSLQVFPNPFSEKTNIRFMIHDTGYMIEKFSLNIYDASGRLVKSFCHDASKRSFTNEVIWDGKNSDGVKVGSGVYFCILAAENEKLVEKILYVKQ